jgi:hypothetical protein
MSGNEKQGSAPFAEAWSFKHFAMEVAAHFFLTDP